jgi:predicted NBD/HSP70 family sugar kinase
VVKTGGSGGPPGWSPGASAGLPARQGTLRHHNLALVLQCISTAEPVSRAGIAAATGLTKTTVSSLVDDLVSAGLVTELGPEASGKIGRPPSALVLNRSGFVGIGLEINVDYLAVCVANLVGEVRSLRTRPRDNRGQSPAKVLGRALRMIRAAMVSAQAAGLTVAGLAVAVPGPVETDRGLLRLAPNLGWVDVPVAEILADRLATRDLPVLVDNEANLAALGELWFGGHDGLDDFVHVSGEIGVGAGIVIDGELFRGVRGFAGEVGHVTVQPDGPRCRCGARGCLEQLAGQEAILRAAGVAGAVGTSLGQPGGSVTELLARARAGEPETLRAVESAGRALGLALSATVNLVDPGTVVLGGLYASLEPWLREPLLAELSERAITQRWSPARVLASRLGPNAAVRGATGAVVKRVLSDPSAVFAAAGHRVAPTHP